MPGMGRDQSPLLIPEALEVPVIDTHCHLSNSRFADDLPSVLATMRNCGLAGAICIATGIDDAKAVQEIVAREPGFLHWSAGLDPFSCFDAGANFPAALQQLGDLLRLARDNGAAACALGEIGLEYYHQLGDKTTQAAQFAAQLDLAADLNLPVVIHCRDAFDDLIAILRNHPRNRGVIHSFIGTAEHARAYLDIGWHLSFNGTVTFKANEFLREALAIVPADRLLVETDAPYLAPVPCRGRRCEPSLVLHTLNLIADYRGERATDVAAWTTSNACSLFDLPVPWEAPQA